MKIALIVVICLSIGVNFFAFFLDKFYKKKVNKNAKNNENL